MRRFFASGLGVVRQYTKIVSLKKYPKVCSRFVWSKCGVDPLFLGSRNFGPSYFYSHVMVHHTPYLTQKRFFAASVEGDSLYDLLGVSKSATAKEIKVAYFRLAKQYHPDVNPSADAKILFQKYTFAYEILSNPATRQDYDKFGKTSSSSSPSGDYDSRSSSSRTQQNSAYAEQHARDVFNSVWEDANMIKEGLSAYFADVQEEFGDAFDAANKGDWKTVGEIAINHKYIIGIMLPLAVFLRFPALIMPAMRVVMGVGGFLLPRLLQLLQRNEGQEIAKRIWQGVIKSAKHRVERRAAKARETALKKK